jgi:hypothetical protein
MLMFMENLLTTSGVYSTISAQLWEGKLGSAFRHTTKLLCAAIPACFLWGMQAHAVGGYLSFPPPAGAPAVMDEVNYYFRMVNNPGSSAGVYYAHNFNLKFNDGSVDVGGYMGLQSASIIPNTYSYALATIWPKAGQVVSLKPGPNAQCDEQTQSAEGHVATCTITNLNILADPLTNGDTFRLRITATPVVSGTKDVTFRIVNMRTGANSVLGTMRIIGVAGVKSNSLSHFLEYFWPNGNSCETTPYTAYTEYAPIGIRQGLTYKYTVVEDAAGLFGPCQNNVAYTPDNSAATVEFSYKTTTSFPQ